MYIKSEAEAPEGDVAEAEGEAAPASVPEGGEGPVTTPPTDTQPVEITASSPPAEMATVSDKEFNSKHHHHHHHRHQHHCQRFYINAFHHYCDKTHHNIFILIRVVMIVFLININLC